MTVMEGVVALGVVIAVGYLIIINVAKNNPKVEEWFRRLFPEKEKIIPEPIKNMTQQIYPERRSMM